MHLVFIAIVLHIVIFHINDAYFFARLAQSKHQHRFKVFGHLQDFFELLLLEGHDHAILIQTTKTFRPKREKKEKIPDNNFNRQRVRAELGREAAEQKAQRDALRPSAVRENNYDEDLRSGKGDQASSPDEPELEEA